MSFENWFIYPKIISEGFKDINGNLLRQVNQVFAGLASHVNDELTPLVTALQCHTSYGQEVIC